MASGTESGGLEPLFRLLVAYRFFVYVGGLFVLGVPLVLSMVGVTISQTARTVLVVAVLCVMVLTYAGERRVGHDHIDPRTGKSTEDYPLGMRVAVALAAVGVAVGVYVAIEVNPLTGLVFVVGAYFFGYLGYRGGRDDGAGDRSDGGDGGGGKGA